MGFVHIMLPACMFSGLIVWHGSINWCTFPWGGPPFPLTALLIASSFLCRVEASWVFLHLVWHVYCCPPCSAHNWADFMDVARQPCNYTFVFELHIH